MTGVMYACKQSLTSGSTTWRGGEGGLPSRPAYNGAERRMIRVYYSSISFIHSFSENYRGILSQHAVHPLALSQASWAPTIARCDTLLQTATSSRSPASRSHHVTYHPISSLLRFTAVQGSERGEIFEGQTKIVSWSALKPRKITPTRLVHDNVTAYHRTSSFVVWWSFVAPLVIVGFEKAMDTTKRF